MNRSSPEASTWARRSTPTSTSRSDSNCCGERCSLCTACPTVLIAPAAGADSAIAAHHRRPIRILRKGTSPNPKSYHNSIMPPHILKNGRLSVLSANDCFTQYGERCGSECFTLLERQHMEPVRMAQRVSGFARRPAGGTRAAERARVNNDPTGQPIPLDLVSVVAPYKRYRGLSLRVEHLAHGARLTHGRNNGDRSWSVAPDELDGLEYLPPNDSYESHTLAVRIISLDGGDGETLAVIDLPIVGRAGADNSMDTPSGALHAEVQRLRDELVKVKSSLAARDTDLATARRTAEDAERSRQSLKMEFSAAEEVMGSRTARAAYQRSGGGERQSGKTSFRVGRRAVHPPLEIRCRRAEIGRGRAQALAAGIEGSTRQGRSRVEHRRDGADGFCGGGLARAIGENRVGTAGTCGGS